MAVQEQTIARVPARPTSPAPAPPSERTDQLVIWLGPTLIATVLAAAYVIISPSSVDLAAQLFRAQLFRQEGFAVWDNYWYSGHNTLSYSVLFPAVSAALTPQLAAALATIGTATLFTPLARRHFGDRALLGTLLFGAATAADLFTGRLAFAFGALPALAAIVALDYEHPVGACALALLAALFSPVAALFAALIAAGYAVGGAVQERRVRAALPGSAVIVAALAPVLIVSVLFPDGGAEPFALSTMIPLLVISVATLVLLPKGSVKLRAGVAIYALATLALYLIPSPIGSNIARMGTYGAAPLAALVWWRRRPLALAIVILPLLYVCWSPPVRDLVSATQDDSASSAYFKPLMRFLHRQSSLPGAAPFRIEIPFTKFHWESYAVATHYPLARGWERQLDIRDNPLFYSGGLTASSYERWLHHNAVRYVAVAGAPLDYSAKAEAALIARGLPYLRLVDRAPDWRVYQVAGATPIVQGPARLQRLGADSLTLHASRPGTVTIHIHFTPYWSLAEGSGCVAPDGSGNTELTIRRAGEVKLVTSFSLGRIGATSPRCT